MPAEDKVELIKIEYGEAIDGHFKGELKVGKYIVPLDIQGLNEYIFLSEMEEICVYHMKAALRAIADYRKKEKETT